MTLETYPDREILAMDVADKLASELRAALAQKDVVSLAVAGGTTPGPIFDVLCDVDLDWDRVRVLPTDERWVPEDDPRSNAKLIRERLLTGRAAAAVQVPMAAAPQDPDTALAELESRIAPLLPLDIVVLGMGADMHTASLFPGTPGLADALAPNAPVLAVLRPESQPEVRVSLTARVLQDAMRTHLVITGADKREALDRARQLPLEEAPVRAILGGTTIHWAE
ncbi:6-phosphogluconolactonase [Marinibacterium profundimaris]|uniref:6-phosphogluconolactonase n=1 Tax=Marinibacterium profundimaris TaxID=1679460 RepID=UPI000B52588E|nr:6-phosphogluconolactonase [Marinibacterium profundimaris]